ncbi:MAG: cadherin domain-containing protein, partial [Tardiphaga sp.]|nr:cadherin domain-containing protein [Tardiphaga sp.]
MRIVDGFIVPENEDLDKLIRSLKKANESSILIQDDDQRASQFPNTHQGSRSSRVDDNLRGTTAVSDARVDEIARTSPDDSPTSASDRQEISAPVVISVAVPADASVSSQMAATDLVIVATPALPGSATGDVVVLSSIPPASDRPLAVAATGERFAAEPAALEAMPAQPPTMIKLAELGSDDAPDVVADVQNQAPSDITVAGGSVQENAAAGTVVATLGAVDPDAGDHFVYALTDPSGKFEIIGNEVRVKAGATLDYETATSHDISLKVTDAGGLSHSETLKIAVTNQNEAPSDITVAGGSVQENAAAGTAVATLGAVDPDAG